MRFLFAGIEASNLEAVYEYCERFATISQAKKKCTFGENIKINVLNNNFIKLLI